VAAGNIAQRVAQHRWETALPLLQSLKADNKDIVPNNEKRRKTFERNLHSF